MDGTGEPRPQEGAPTSPGGKALEEKQYLSLSPSLPAIGVEFPTPRFSGGSSAFWGCESQPTPNRRHSPPLPLVEGSTDAHFSLQSTPRARHYRFQDTGPTTTPREGTAGRPAALHMQMRRGGRRGGHACSPRRSPRAGAQIPLPPVTELVPLCRLSRNQSRHGCDT